MGADDITIVGILHQSQQILETTHLHVLHFRMQVVCLWFGDDISSVAGITYVAILVFDMVTIFDHHVHKVMIMASNLLIAEEVTIAGISHTLLHRISMLADSAMWTPLSANTFEFLMKSSSAAL